MSWEVKNKTKNPFEEIVESMTGGLLSSPSKYTIEDEDTGVRKESYAYDNDELADNIKKGKIH
jgi:hypothetical protein